MIKSRTTAAVLSLCLGTFFAITASAQSNANASKKDPPKASSTPASDAAPPEERQGSDQSEETQPKIEPVLWISSVEAMRSTHGPALDVIRVRGITSTEGWQAGELVPLTKGPSTDGILDLAFVAQAPTSATAPSPSPVIEAVFTIEPGHPFKGVRVHGATNRVTLRSIPGYAESANAPSDCSDCVGKYFVAKGETAPSGANASDVIHEESLPKTLHVVKPNDGIGKMDSDPNRLTLVLSEDGRIVIAVWD